MAQTYSLFVAFVTPTGARIMYYSAFPTLASDGAYNAGDIIYNTTPTAAGIASPIGWACTVGGSPGTWSAFGGLTSAGMQKLAAATGAIPVTGGGTYVITYATGAGAYTLAAPTATTQDGMRIDVTSNTAQAHTITATGLFQGGVVTDANVVTFAAFAGASIALVAYQGKWNILSANQCPMTS